MVESPGSARPPLSDDGHAGVRIAESVRFAIIGGDYPPGMRILQEDLAVRFGASRVPVRQALEMLEHEGLVTGLTDAGARVSQLSLKQCVEIYLIRERLEPLLLRDSAPHLSSDQIEELSRLAHRIGVVGADTDAFLALDRDFHLVSYAGAQTLQLADLMQNLWNTTAPYRRARVGSWTPDSRRLANEEHHLIVAALRAQDSEEAERVLAKHIRRTRQQLGRTPEIFAPAPEHGGDVSVGAVPE